MVPTAARRSGLRKGRVFGQCAVGAGWTAGTGAALSFQLLRGNQRNREVAKLSESRIRKFGVPPT